MVVTVIYPADQIGDKEHEYLFFPQSTAIPEILDETRKAFEATNIDGLPAKLKIRPMALGDVIQIDGKFYIVSVHICRPVSEESAKNWRKRTLVERMLGSGHHERVCSGLHQGVKT